MLPHQSSHPGMTEIGLIQRYSSQQPMVESVIRFVILHKFYLHYDGIMYLQTKKE